MNPDSTAWLGDEWSQLPGIFSGPPIQVVEGVPGVA